MSIISRETITIDLINPLNLVDFPYSTVISKTVSHIDAMRWCVDHIGEHQKQWVYDIDGTIGFTTENDLVWFKMAWH